MQDVRTRKSPKNTRHVRFFVRKPLTCQTRPIQRMRDHNIIQIWRVFLPAARGEVSNGKEEDGMRSQHHVLYSYITQFTKSNPANEQATQTYLIDELVLLFRLLVLLTNVPHAGHMLRRGRTVRGVGGWKERASWAGGVHKAPNASGHKQTNYSRLATRPGRRVAPCSQLSERIAFSSRTHSTDYTNSKSNHAGHIGLVLTVTCAPAAHQISRPRP